MPASAVPSGASDLSRTRCGMATLPIATCQFSTSSDIATNLAAVVAQMRQAAAGGARVVHFCEGALSGYAGADFASFEGFQWNALEDATQVVTNLATELGLWVVLGSAHPLTPPHRPHNSTFIIDDAGQLVDRYDKRFCSGDLNATEGDLAHYSPGDHFSVWVIDGIRCGALICYDYRFPELLRSYRADEVEVLFHSFHAGALTSERIQAIGEAIGHDYEELNPAPTFTYPGITMPAAMTTAAACNHLWISCSNSSAPESAWPAFFVRADGVTTGRLERNVPGVLFSTVDTEQALYDSTAPWRRRALAGVLHSGTVVADPRSSERQRF